MIPTETTTKHRHNCTRVFDRYDPMCPRCDELKAGFPARRGWGGSGKYSGTSDLSYYCFACPPWAASPCPHGKRPYTD